MPIWLEKLKEYESGGFKEIVGKKSNPKILKWAHGVGKADYMVDDSATPWCGIGLAGVLDECNLGNAIPKAPAAAISWLNCGVPCEPKAGAIAVFPRPGGNHVTVIDRIEGDTWHCTGCNQSNSICTRPFDGREAKGTRWPIEIKTPKAMEAESRIAAAAARQQADAAKGTAAGSTAPAIPVIPTPPKAAVQHTIDNVFFDISWAKQTANNMLEFAGFLGNKWPWIAGAIALYFFTRMAWDSHLIKTWRTEDHNAGYTT